VQAIHGVPAAFLKAQLQSVLDDIGVDAVKIGMLHALDIVEVVAWAIDHYQLKNVVLDPVMVATSGDRLIASDTVQVLVRELFPRAALITPNLDEAALLLQQPITDAQELDAAAQALLAMGAQAVLLKGGHLPGDALVDVLLQPGQPLLRMGSARIPSRNVHGTGCSLSSAIAAHLALGQGLADAVKAARHFIRAAIAAGAAVKTGQGHGPLNHGHAPQPNHKLPL
jgi:hydroxymethylpyrimidine/phosphomethylpyrimidine kinase